MFDNLVVRAQAGMVLEAALAFKSQHVGTLVQVQSKRNGAL